MTPSFAPSICGKSHDRTASKVQQRRARPSRGSALRAARSRSGRGRQPRAHRRNRHRHRSVRGRGGHIDRFRVLAGSSSRCPDLVCPHWFSGCAPLWPSRAHRANMTGTVNADLEAVLRISIFDAVGQLHVIDAVIDTGFNGFLTLPPSLTSALGLKWLCRQQGQLADGSLQAFDVYVATVDWDGQGRSVEVDAANTQPLLGMALLHGSELKIQVKPGGAVEIVALT